MIRRIWRMGVRASEIDFSGDSWLYNGNWETSITALRQWSLEEGFSKD